MPLNVYTTALYQKSKVLDLTGKPQRYFPIQGRIENGRPCKAAQRIAFKLMFGREPNSNAIRTEDFIEVYQNQLWYRSDINCDPVRFAPIEDDDYHWAYITD